MLLMAAKYRDALFHKPQKGHSGQGRIHRGAIGAIAPLAANFLNVVCEFSMKFFLLSVCTINKSVRKKANLPFSLDVQKLKGFQLPPDQGLYSWTPLGALPPDPCYRLALPRLPCRPLLRKPSGSAPDSGRGLGCLRYPRLWLGSCKTFVTCFFLIMVHYFETLF